MFLALFASVAATASAKDISASSALGRQLLEQAEGRRLDDNFAFLTGYSLKFQGCHHVQQWNDNADEENDVRIMTKRLARFRLCEADSCSNERSAGCNSKYGDYVVDMDTFVQAYLQSMEEDEGEFCNEVYNDCAEQCKNDEGDSGCTYDCYEGYNAEFCLDEDDNGFNAQEYAECREFDLPDNNNGGRRKLEDQAQYFLGAYCADQGGEIRIGMFTDDTCTTFASNGNSLFKSAMGFTLPFSQHSLVTNRCLSCLEANDNGNYGTKEVCTGVYEMAGKCETKMSIDYPNESSCNYIEGVKIIRQDGVIRTSATRKSKSAAVAIGLFSTISVLLAGYVFYLRTKLSRAQINLAAASQSLT